MNRLDALKIFCIAAETLQFRETAIRLSISPQVVTRVISELESELGELLFIRNTRNMQLTEFGESFLPQAQAFLSHEKKLFSGARETKNMAGIVRITTLSLPQNDQILSDLLDKCRNYPELKIDWRVDAAKLKNVEDQIDIGIRISVAAEPLMIVRKIASTRDKIVASQQLLDKYGVPKDLETLLDNYPTSGLIDVDKGRIWGWPLNGRNDLIPKKSVFVTDDSYSELQSAISGYSIALLPDYICNEALEKGDVIELLADIDRPTWQLYLYRPYRTVTSYRVLQVYEWLTEILKKYY